MKLYLTSFKLGDEPEKLVSLVGENKRAAIICNAIDVHTGDDRSQRVIREIQAMSELGFSAEEVDLRDYFDNPKVLKGKLSEYGLLWIRGGNAFVLRKAMKLSGFDQIIRTLLNENIVYAGYSAASCVAGPTLHGVELCDDKNVTPAGYPKETVWDGLGLIDYAIAPHYKSDHPESKMIDEVVAYFEHEHIAYKTLRDGETIVVND